MFLIRATTSSWEPGWSRSMSKRKEEQKVEIRSMPNRHQILWGLTARKLPPELARVRFLSLLGGAASSASVSFFDPSPLDLPSDALPSADLPALACETKRTRT